MRVGYAGVSTSGQSPEKASGARDDRPLLARIPEDVLRAGDTLAVRELDRLARSLKKLIATAEQLEQ